MSACSEDIFIESVIDEEEPVSPFKDKNAAHKSTNGLYQCNKCNRKFTLSSNLNRHKRYNKICGYVLGFECTNCHKMFSLNATLKDHYQRCIAEDPYRFRCPNCPKQFTFKSSLNKHLRGRCPNFKKPSHLSDHVFKCQHCSAELYSRTALERHENSGVCTLETSPEQHTCPHCGNNFTMKSSLKKHLKGRCKVIKSKEKDVKNDQNVKIVYVGETSNSREEESYVYEAILDDENIIEESIEEDEEILPNDVPAIESYVEISYEVENSEGKEFEYQLDEDVNSNDS